MKVVEERALEAYPVDMQEELAAMNFSVEKDFNEFPRTKFIEGFERALKEVHAWACEQYNILEMELTKRTATEITDTTNTGDSINEGEIKGKMGAFQEMKRKICSMY